MAASLAEPANEASAEDPVSQRSAWRFKDQADSME
jgi:hypothetical protein